MKGQMSRRKFIGSAALATAGFTIVPSTVISGLGHKAPSDKLNIAGVGVGGKGFGLTREMQTENIVALCDVDWRYSKNCFDYFPQARHYWDWRKMYDEMIDDIDAVVVATSDHTHAAVAAHAIAQGKHVYVEKPLTHTVYESRLLTRLADKYKVATQMGNQGASGDGVSTLCEWIWNDEIGEIRKVEAFTDRPIWPQGLARPSEGQAVPDTLNWDLFIGPAPMRPYNEIYTPWNFRGWWDFGTGALGDMACHILHPAFKALKLGYPIKAQGTSTLLLQDSAPQAQKVSIVFPARPNDPQSKMAFPEVEVVWYDGGLQPSKPEGWPAGRNMNQNGGGVLFHGTKDTLVVGCYGREPWLLSGRVPSVPKTLRRVHTTHEQDWIRACKESPDNRLETTSYFKEAGPFNEMVVMGVLAVRLQELHKTLTWDGQNMAFTNIGDNETIRIVVEDGFQITDGHPTFDKSMTDPINAKAFAQELIKHNYRQGWDLPAMP
jgi:hypothetical protein